MGSILTLTDQTWKTALQGKTALILVTTGADERSGLNTALKHAAVDQDRVIIAELDPRANPRIAAHLGVTADEPLLIGWHDDADIVRRAKPWGTDVSFIIEILERTMSESPQTPVDNNKPFVVTDASFQKEVIDFSKDTPVLVDFWAAWCGPCRMVAPIMDKLAAEFGGQVRIAKVDTDANPALSQAFRVMSIPTIMAFKDGQMVFNEAGAYPEPTFRNLVQQLIELKIPAETETQDEK